MLSVGYVYGLQRVRTYVCIHVRTYVLLSRGYCGRRNYAYKSIYATFVQREK